MIEPPSALINRRIHEEERRIEPAPLQDKTYIEQQYNKFTGISLEERCLKNQLIIKKIISKSKDKKIPMENSLSEEFKEKPFTAISQHIICLGKILGIQIKIRKKILEVTKDRLNVGLKNRV